jgi:hypothetical protein
MQICSPPYVAKLAGYQPFAAVCLAVRARRATFKRSRVKNIFILMIDVIFYCLYYSLGIMRRCFAVVRLTGVRQATILRFVICAERRDGPSEDK